jgi:hypothetical protein
MIGIVLDSFLMLLLVAAIGYGVRLEKKLTALRAGQLAFAGAVTELNQAAGRAENALQRCARRARKPTCCTTASSRPARSSRSWTC